MMETYFVSTSIGSAGAKCVDVYRNGKRDLLVLSTGSAIPPAYSANKWRRSRTRILNVSDEIKSTVQRQGYYVRSLRVANKGITLVRAQSDGGFLQSRQQGSRAWNRFFDGPPGL